MPASTIIDIQDAIATVAARVGPAVVGFGRGWGRGSGVVVAPGQVITVAHNLRGESTTVSYGDGRRARGRVAGADSDLDLAVVEVDTGSVEPVEWDPEVARPSIGAVVVALASPGGRGLRATPGFVSAGERSFRGPRGRRVEGAVEHTAPLPRGSGGGPLVDLEGRLLGLNAIRLEGGLILAIPGGPKLAERSAALFRGERAEPVRLGVAIAPAYVARRLRQAVGLPERAGLLVRSVAAGSPAERAGLVRGDLIVEAGGRALSGIDALYETLDATAPGATLKLAIVRGAEQQEASVRFAQPAAAGGGS